ncbi:transporter substrate-binding domain-containing protein [uncultured Tateyamaria sp.]|uniref:substrate-binding periplasmic protein n=1 Tax=uncultured Tateyamaria sp. TaxID=455651 RepID=UPI0026234A09|nr:transporter substrate-binding domain-containing protein [uncultured Tateyamaria sp.]
MTHALQIHVNLRRIVLAATAALAIFAALSQPAKAQQNDDTDCVVAAHYPPYIIGNTPTNAGISIDIMRAAAARAGRTIRFEIMPFKRTLHVLATDATCMMPVLYRNKTREPLYRWIAAYDATELHFLTVGAPVNTIEEGRQLGSIGVEISASAYQLLSGLGFENLVEIANPLSSARMLHAGRIDAWAQSSKAATGVWNGLGLEPPLQAGDPIYAVPVYVVAGLGFPDELAEIYKTAIESLVADGTAARIISSYE